MNCRFCGSQLLPEAKFCSHCRALASASSSISGSSDDPTVVSVPYSPQSGPSPAPTVAELPVRFPSYTPPPVYGAPLCAPSNQQNPSPAPVLQHPYSPLPPAPPPYVPPQAGIYPASPPFTPAASQGQRAGPRSPIGLILLLMILAVLLIAGSSLIYYAAVYQPNQMHAQQTATADVQLTGTAHAQATAQTINATATAEAENPYTHTGTLALFDPLHDNSKGFDWTQDPINCGFMDGAYHAKAPDAHYSDYCLTNASNFSNFAFEVQMQILKGDAGCIVFRVENTNPNQLYQFFVGQDGSYQLYKQNGTSFPLLTNGTIQTANRGLNQTNLIAVVAQGNLIKLYVNHQLITSITDSTYSHGQIGVCAGTLANGGHPTEVAFSNARVWTL